jgi:GGDEF domain-containing protein
MVCPDTTAVEARAIADRIRLLTHAPKSAQGSVSTLTVSIGIADLEGSSARPEKLLENAAVALERERTQRREREGRPLIFREASSSW